MWKSSAGVNMRVLKLNAHDVVIVYRSGAGNIVDGLSRLNSEVDRDKGEIYDYVRVIVENSVPIALSARDIDQESMNDEELQRIKSGVKTGILAYQWKKCILFPLLELDCVFLVNFG